MEITPMCKAVALHEIFDKREVGAGGSVPLAEVEQAWARTGLRASDLRDALADARVTGEFDLAGDGPAAQVKLTELGYAHAQRDLSSLCDIEALIGAYETLRVVRSRHPLGTSYGRRRDDRLDS
jgi:hypothetical protein